MDDFSTPHPMLRLPLRRPAGCGCLVAALVVVALLILSGGVYAWIEDRGWTWPPPRTALVTSTMPPTANPLLTANSSPTAMPSLTAIPSPPAATATLPPAEATATSSPAPTATSTPAATPSPTYTPPATPTHTPTATPTLPPTATSTVPATPTAATVGAVACNAAIKAVIELAAEAQAQYIEGTLEGAALSAAWGGAAADAQEEAGRLLAYIDAFVPQVEIENVVWTVLECQMMPQPGWVRVTTSERWAYHAALECVPGERRAAARVELFPAQVYALSWNGQAWQIDSWLTGPAEVEAQWRCPS